MLPCNRQVETAEFRSKSLSRLAKIVFQVYEVPFKSQYAVIYKLYQPGVRVRPRIVSLGCSVPLKEVGDVVVHLAASDGHDSVCAVPAAVDVQPVALDKFP